MCVFDMWHSNKLLPTHLLTYFSYSEENTRTELCALSTK